MAQPGDKDLFSRKRGDILEHNKSATRERSRSEGARIPENLSGGLGLRIFGPGAAENKTRKPFKGRNGG